MKTTACDICNKPLEPHENIYRSHVHSTRKVCDEHQLYHAMHTRTVILQNMLKIAPYPNDLKCDICKCILLAEEKAALGQQHVNITCFKHNEVRSWMQIDLAILWYRFKEKNPTAWYEFNLDPLFKPNENSWAVRFQLWYSNLTHDEYLDILQNQFNK